MKPSLTLTFFVVTLLSAFAFTQDSAPNASQSESGAASVAYLYVAGGTNNNYQINAYGVASNGKLTPVEGSPFSEAGFFLGTNNRKWLFSSDGVYIYSFKIAANGAPKQVASINAQQYNGSTIGGPARLFSDRKGGNVYDLDYNDGNYQYQSFSLDNQTGVLTFLGMDSVANAVFITPLSFVGNDQYGYGASCVYGNQEIYGFSRSSDGSLVDLNLSPLFPAAPSGEGAYCPSWAAADNGNNVAISLTPNLDMKTTGPSQLAVYTADSSGNLTTNSTADNMPTSTVGVYEMAANPAGNLLAVDGPSGVQVFHFNGANPITSYTDALTTASIGQVAWDNANHLYALGGGTNGQLYVFTVTPTSVKSAPGSPYSIANASGLAVLSKP
jgi:hypothetical protein